MLLVSASRQKITICLSESKLPHTSSKEAHGIALTGFGESMNRGGFGLSIMLGSRPGPVGGAGVFEVTQLSVPKPSVAHTHTPCGYPRRPGRTHTLTHSQTARMYTQTHACRHTHAHVHTKQL